MPERDAPATAASEEGTPERKKAKQQRSSSAVSDAGAAAGYTEVADKSGIVCTHERGAPGDADIIPERKEPKLKKQKKKKMQQSPCAVSDADAVNTGLSDNSGNVCTNGEGAPGDADVAPERKKAKLKKHKKDKQQRSSSAVSDASAAAVDTDVADKSGIVCTHEEGAPGDTDVIPERKEPKLKKQRKNKRQQSPSAVSDADADAVDTGLSDNSGNVCTNGEGAPGDSDVVPERMKPKLKKQKKDKRQESPSSVSDAGADAVDTDVVDKSGNVCTNGEGAPGDADVILERKKPKLKKQKKNKRQQSLSAVSDSGADAVDTDAADKSGSGCPNGEGAPGDADVIMSPINGHDPNCPEVDSAEDSVKGKKENKDNSQSCSSLQETSLETNSRARKRRRRRTSNVQDSSLQPSAVEADLVTTADGNNTPASECKKSKKRKRNQTGVSEAPLVDDAALVEGKDAGGTGSIGKVDGEAQHARSEEDPNMFTKNKRSSICASEEATANNTSLTLVQGVEFNAKAKADCLHARPQAHKDKVRNMYSPRGSLIRFQRKKLLILDLNGLLADINQDHHNAHMADAKVRGKLVFKRPYYDDFLRFCFQNFELGIWSSRMKVNVNSVVDTLMKDLKQYLLFCWDLSKCTTTGCNTLENRHKPLVLKELKKLWNKEEPDLPWEQGEFSPSNTLLVDDSPYKALGNPPHTAIFPLPYSYRNKRDNSLGPGGDLRVYLENLAAADDIQCYVREHPFGQSSITKSHRHWNFYVQILDKLDKSLA